MQAGRSEGAPASALQRTVALPQAVALYVGAVLGAGVLILPGVAASEAGPASLLAWLFVGLLGLPIGLTFAALARQYPDAGGVSTFAAQAFGPAAGAIVGWWYFAAGSAGQAMVALTGAYYVTDAAGWPAGSAFAIALGILLLGVGANLVGLGISARLQLALAAAVAVVLLAAIVASFPNVDVDRLRPFAPNGLGAIAQVAIPLFFAFAGWEAVTHLAEEFHDPADLRRATLATAAIVVSLYFGVSLAVVLTGNYGTPQLNRVAVADLLGDSLGVGAKTVAALTAAVISVGTVNAFVAGTSRLGYALGRDDAFPASLGRLDRRGVPRVSILAVGLVASATLGLALVTGLGAEDLVLVPSSLVVTTYIVALAAGVKLLSGPIRRGSLIGLGCCCAVAPFAGTALTVPAVSSVATLLYLRMRRKRGVADTPMP